MNNSAEETSSNQRDGRVGRVRSSKVSENIH